METKNEVKVLSLKDDSNVIEFERKILELRKNGETAYELNKDKIREVKKNKMLSKEQKENLIAELTTKVEKAKEIKVSNKEELKNTIKEAKLYVKTLMNPEYKRVSILEKENRKEFKKQYRENLKLAKVSHSERLSSIDNSDQIALNKEKAFYKSVKFDLKKQYKDAIQSSKTVAFDTHMDIYNELNFFGGGKVSYIDSKHHDFLNYIYKFNAKNFLLSNALYLVIAVFFIACFIISPLIGKGNLLTIRHIFALFEQSATPIFYALGVAGLILLAGTDLSIGRMVGLGSVITAVILHQGPNIVEFFGMGKWDFTAIPMFVRVIMAMGLSILLCTAFSALAGFFTAKFKMHPFITTLSTQLIIYGTLYFATKGLPTGTIEPEIQNLIGGNVILFGYKFPKIFFYAVIAIIIVAFIWNKTKFGKNMYAVGGNPEAASVSGISVFWTTLGVFIMAGILYGFGSFFEAFRSNASAGTGTGFELNAIAACVVGGISFSGGIGKIKGAVIGVFIFSGLTYCLTVLGIDTNLQFVLKGVIIMAAVALDCAKYLKKK